MAKSRIDEALAALRAAGDDSFGARREVLERVGLELLHRPALGGQIVARLCAIPEPTPGDEGLLDLLGAGLDASASPGKTARLVARPSSIAPKTRLIWREVRAA